jgi:hypothetical protein
MPTQAYEDECNKKVPSSSSVTGWQRTTASAAAHAMGPSGLAPRMYCGVGPRHTVTVQNGVRPYGRVRVRHVAGHVAWAPSSPLAARIPGACATPQGAELPMMLRAPHSQPWQAVQPTSIQGNEQSQLSPP